MRTARAPCEQQPQIAFGFLLDDTRRISRMIERQPRRHHHLAPHIAAEILHMFVNAPHKADMRCTTKDTLNLGGCPHESTRIHINIDKMYDESVHRIFFIVFLNQRPHARSTFFGKILIRIGKDHPVPRRLIERKILRCSEVIDPVKTKDLSPTHACNLHRCIRRSRIDHDHLIGKDTHGREPARQICRLVLRDDTGRDLHCISSINSFDFRCMGASTSTRARYFSASARRPSCSEAKAIP